MLQEENVTFLVIDDDEVSVMAIKRAIRSLKLLNDVMVARDGEEALDLLRTKDSGLCAKPYIILLDINMPRMNGLEFLAEVRDDPCLRTSVIFMVTTSEAPSDIAAAYDHLVAGYIVKENAMRSLRDALEMLGSYVRIVRLPIRPEISSFMEERPVLAG